jgi:hypothetical protein
VQLRSNDNAFAADIPLQKSTKDLFTFTERIDIRSVKEVDSQLERLPEKGLAFLFIQRPGMTAGPGNGNGGAIAHAAQADTGNFESRFSQVDIFHEHSPRFASAPGRFRYQDSVLRVIPDHMTQLSAV